LQGSPGTGGRCRYASTGFINTGVTGTSFATGRTVAPTVFDIDILQDGKCYSPQDYSVLNYAAVRALHVLGAKVIGYIDAGTAETWRPDFRELQAFDQSCDGCLFGNPLGNFPDEYWLNINSNVTGTNPNTGRTESAQQFLLDEMQARLKEAKLIGVDAIEFDDVDGWQSHNGLSLTAADQLRYNRLIAKLAHDRGMAVGLKNDLDQIPQLVGDFDFAVNEQCAQYGECAAMKPFIKAGKAVFHVEYELPASRFCAQSRRLKLSSMLKKYELGVWRRAC